MPLAEPEAKRANEPARCVKGDEGGSAGRAMTEVRSKIADTIAGTPTLALPIGVNLRPKTSKNNGFAALLQRLFPSMASHK